MIPIVKGWSTEMAQHVASLGVQVHGGMGYIEETGAAQYLRDARITTIYEGTTGIQANDLIGRKIARDGGKALAAHDRRDARNASARWQRAEHDELAAIGARLGKGIDALEEAGRFVVSRFRDDPRVGAGRCGAVPRARRHRLRRRTSSAARRSSPRASSRAGEGDAVFLRAKIATARHFADHCLTHAPGLRDTVVSGAAGALAVADEAL